MDVKAIRRIAVLLRRLFRRPVIWYTEPAIVEVCQLTFEYPNGTREVFDLVLRGGRQGDRPGDV